MDLTDAPEAVRQLVELIDDRATNPSRFRPARVEVTRNGDEGCKVSAFDGDGRPFPYAVYTDRGCPAIADAY